MADESAFVGHVKRLALELDAWIGASLYSAGQRLADAYDRFASRMDRIGLSGGQRVLADLASEAVTLGAVGSVVLLFLAIPAFRETGGDDWLKRQDLAVVFLDRYGEEIGRRGIKHDDSLKLEEFPDHFIKAVLATEDRRFYEHYGIDPWGLMRAITVNARASGVVQGGSSLTQQLAKNLFLSNERSLQRKINEAFLALWLESRLSKQEILKLYLDRAYMGGGTFGAAAAAEYYFGKSARDLTLAEAAMLAGLFKAPTRYAPHVNLPAARARANDVLANMVDAGFLTEGQIQAARRNPATPVDRKRDPTPDYYLDWAFGEIKDMSGRGLLGNERVLTVKTPLDTAIQARAEATVESVIRQHEAAAHVKQGAMVVMDPDGAVRAMVGGRDYGASQFNRAVDGLRQPGSSFKPFVYTAALSAGLYKPNTIVVDRPTCIGNWCPNNYGRSYAGSIPLHVALAKSINTIPVQMSQALGKGNAKLGRVKIVEMARKMGLTTPLADSTSLPIGSAEVTVLDMTAGYSVFANGGKRAKPYAAMEVRNGRGDVLWRHDRNAPPAEQVVATSVIADMNSMLLEVVEAGTGRRAMLDGIKVAGKTGTTNAYKDAWFVGFTGNLVGGVWIGNDDSTSMVNMTGGVLPATIWHDVMVSANQGLEPKPIPGIPLTFDPKVAKAGKPGDAAPAEGGAPPTLSRRSFEVISGIERLFSDGRARQQAQRGTGPRAALDGNAGPAGPTIEAAAGPRPMLP